MSDTPADGVPHAPQPNSGAFDWLRESHQQSVPLAPLTDEIPSPAPAPFAPGARDSRPSPAESFAQLVAAWVPGPEPVPATEPAPGPESEHTSGWTETPVAPADARPAGAPSPAPALIPRPTFMANRVAPPMESASPVSAAPHGEPIPPAPPRDEVVDSSALDPAQTEPDLSSPMLPPPIFTELIEPPPSPPPVVLTFSAPAPPVAPAQNSPAANPPPPAPSAVDAASAPPPAPPNYAEPAQIEPVQIEPVQTEPASLADFPFAGLAAGAADSLPAPLPPTVFGGHALGLERRTNQRRSGNTALDVAALVAAIVIAPIGLILGIIAAIVGKTTRGFVAGITRGAIIVAVILSLCLGVVGVAVAKNAAATAAHNATIASSVNWCATLTSNPATLESATLGWPAPGDTIPDSLTPIASYVSTWKKLEAEAPAGVHAGTALVESTAAGIYSQVASSQTLDDASDVSQMQAAVANSNVKSWATEYCK